jgi:nuclear transport factor 2 (NTF2) superfamily protein
MFGTLALRITAWRKTLWCYTDKQIGVSYEYEWHDDSGQWYRSSGNEFWEFKASGLIEQRIARIYDVPIDEAEPLCKLQAIRNALKGPST